VVPDIYNLLTAPHIQDSIFSWMFLRRYWWYINNSMCVMLQTWCQHSAQPPDFAMWSVVSRYTMQLQYRIIRLQYSTERICATIGDISTIQRALYCKYGAKYSTHRSVYDMWTVLPDVYNAFRDPHFQASIFNWTYLRCYSRYLDNSKRVLLQTVSQIQRTPSGLHYVNCGPGHMQCI
jgi:hypothetical protein